MNNDFTFLSVEQISGLKKLDLIAKRGTSARMTDYAVILGCHGNDYKAKTGNMVGCYWLNSPNRKNEIITSFIDENGQIDSDRTDQRFYGGRPVLSFSSFDDTFVDKVCGRTSDGLLEVEYGQYPQTAAPKNLQNKLEKLFKKGSLRKTGGCYTFDSVDNSFSCYKKSFEPSNYDEYEFEGKRYIRARAKFSTYSMTNNFGKMHTVLSNGQKYKSDDYVWIEVSPIKWLVSEEDKLMITENIIFSGIQYKHAKNFDKPFNEIDIKVFMNNYFSKQILQHRSIDLNGKDNSQKQSIENEIKKLEQLKKELEREKNIKNNPSAEQKNNDYNGRSI